MSATDPDPVDRVPGRSYRLDPLDAADGSWELGWDVHLGAFFAQQVDVDVDGTVLDVGTKIFELAAIERLGELIGRPIPADVATELYQDALARPAGTDAPAVLADWVAALYRQFGIAPRWSLPAAPVADLLHAHAAEWGNRDPQTVGSGLGLEAGLVRGVLDGSIPELGITQIADVCEALRCSPFDMWGVDAARSILHAYGPEDWPTYIEPLHEHPDPPAGEGHWGLPTVGQGAIVTGYRSAGHMTLDVTGQPVDPWQVATGEVELGSHHPVFAQVAEPQRSSLALNTVTAPGDDRPSSDLTTVASALRSDLQEPFDNLVELVRFTSPEREVWLGWNHTTETWQIRGDPREGYTGPATDVLDGNGLITPESLLAEDTRPPDRLPPPPIGDQGPFRHGSDVIVTGYRRTALLAIDDHGHASAVSDDNATSDAVDYHYAFTQATRPSTYALFGTEPEAAGSGVDPFLASVASYRVTDADTGSGDTEPRIDMVRISPTSDGHYAAGPEVWLGWHPETHTWELWDDPRRHYPGPATTVLNPGNHVAPEHWDATQERLAINTHDSPGIPEPQAYSTFEAAPQEPDVWLHEPPEPPDLPQMEI
jgi:hypothetical protein